MDATTARFHSFLERNALIIEVTLLLLSFASILLYYFDIPSSSLFLVRSVNLIAIIYFFLLSFEGHQIRGVGDRIIAIGFSLAILGAMFKLLHYPAEELMPKIGVLSMSMAFLIWGFKNLSKWSNQLIALVVRLCLITTLGLVLWYL